MFPEDFKTTRLALRPISAEDVQAIFDGYGQDREVTQYLTWRPHQSIADTHSFVQMCLRAETSRTYMIVLEATGNVIGVFDLRKTGQFKLEFGYALAREHWGQGLMTEALVEVVNWALRQSDIWRIGAAVDVDNVGSIRVMEKAGLQREGILRRWLVHPNTGDAPRDCVIFSKTR
ncbi:MULTISPECIES: GNAT family N-acetyltransferase [unclassified Sphingobium]|jgi:ribosomal-protein-alanine N-acetyltransferase|uniref:GNAT family N-acetyltransferase n=1 Tax=unclassified Sphingobium TaxID=2611147 RepID=UPI000C9F2FDD|nr:MULTISPECIES: GNAT family N-acetyltransferase [unclassified Sphingobium]PNQ03442.1 hypothetical protein A8G00_11375 [Sphingobium sp. SA916]WDA35191.1 GNAT family N-acetyltransferase [Sphingobium sp. YC-XJ3]WDA37273.1 GNAT family N-acetyltransferase [Sphingobium sp. YC-XJ3]WDA38840.1 GNAT family N-acetyltransferase [Sphingobium sp. YC-XJ3]